ncbi:hypothetical protein [Luteolibacter pohnpeiensis]|nr:hypothetical protein [Luteolibacter pohnpeiensis]
MKSCLGLLIVVLVLICVIGGGGLLYYLSENSEFSAKQPAAESTH